MSSAPKPIKHKVDLIQNLRDKLSFKFLCLHSVLFWKALHLFYLAL